MAADFGNVSPRVAVSRLNSAYYCKVRGARLKATGCQLQIAIEFDHHSDCSLGRSQRAETSRLWVVAAEALAVCKFVSISVIEECAELIYGRLDYRFSGADVPQEPQIWFEYGSQGYSKVLIKQRNDWWPEDMD